GPHELRPGIVHIPGGKGRAGCQGRLSLSLKDPLTPAAAHLELTDAYLHDLIDLAVGLVPTLSSVNQAKDVDGHVTGVLDVDGPVARPEATVVLAMDGVSLWDEQFDNGSARLRLHGQEPRLQVEELDLRHGAALVKRAGR